jgi:hypothetical protein
MPFSSKAPHGVPNIWHGVFEIIFSSFVSYNKFVIWEFLQHPYKVTKTSFDKTNQTKNSLDNLKKNWMQVLLAQNNGLLQSRSLGSLTLMS